MIVLIIGVVVWLLANAGLALALYLGPRRRRLRVDSPVAHAVRLLPETERRGIRRAAPR